MSTIDRLTKLRQSTLEKFTAQVYRVFANGEELLYEGRSPTVYLAGAEDVIVIPNYEFGQRAWRASIPVGSQNASQVRLDARWVLQNGTYQFTCRAASINLANVGNVFEVILVEQVFQ